MLTKLPLVDRLTRVSLVVAELVLIRVLNVIVTVSLSEVDEDSFVLPGTPF